MRSRIGSILCVFSLLVALTGCGGGDSGGSDITPPPTSGTPPPPSPPPPPPPPIIGLDGGTATDGSGASVVAPAGAFAVDTTVRIAVDSSGAPPLPTGMQAAGNMYVVTPHGGDFPQPVTVSIPAPTTTLLPTQQFRLAKAQPNGPWEILDTAVADGKLKASVHSFSFFTAIVITYPLPVFQFEPFKFTITADCAGQDCTRLVGSVDVTFSVVPNGGQLPAGCENPVAHLLENSGNPLTAPVIPMTGITYRQTVPPTSVSYYGISVSVFCNETYAGSWSRALYWSNGPQYPQLEFLRMPSQLDVVEGHAATLEAVFAGGAARITGPGGCCVNAPTVADRAVIDWQRSDDGGASWRPIARSFQNEGNPLPFGTGRTWRPWGVKHGFVATATDQGALIRVYACYTPPAGTEPPPCVWSTAARLNVLQQSALPDIATPPRSVLIRTGQTASFSVAASGAPAPTLQWQTRAANSTGAWSDVTTGTGATSANYTTDAMALADNGTQYRVVATNAVGSMASVGVTLSVSDLDVAPTIATQPANLGVAAGSDAVFAVDARGTEALSYQWYRNGAALAGANSPVLRLAGVTILNAGSFSVRVSNAAGSADSTAATLNVYPGTPAAVAPTIVTQPAPVTVNVGNTATFAVGVDGSGPFTFQWRKDGVNIAGAMSAVLTLNNVATIHSGSYSVVVGNEASPNGVASGNVLLTVNAGGATAPPSIVTQPSSVVVVPGGSAVLAVGATGSGPLTYQWLKDNVAMPGETRAVLVLPDVDDSKSGTYVVRVSNALGLDTSQMAFVTLLGSPLVTTNPANASVFENFTATFQVAAVGPRLHYQWLRNGMPIAASDSATYTTASLTVADSGALYSVIVHNGAGLVLSAPAVLTVTVPVPPTILQQPADVTVDAGQPANLCMAFGGTPPFSVQMNRWSGAEWTPIGSRVSFADNAPTCISTPNLQATDNGAQFLFFASTAESGPTEAMTHTVTVTVRAPPAVTSTMLASRSTAGVTADNRSSQPSVSADGNLVAFISDGTNLVPGYVGSAFTAGNAYLHDMSTGVTTQINVTPAGTQSERGVVGLKLAAGGRYAIFSSLAGDLVADDTNGSQDIFVRDFLTGTTQRITLRPDGSEIPPSGNGVGDFHLDISADGRFASFAFNYDLVSGDPNAPFSLYFRDIRSGFTRLVASSDAAGVFGYSALSGNGEHLVYLYATFAPGSTRNTVYDYDTEAHDLHEVFSIDSTNNVSFVGQGMDVSSNGRYVTFPLRSPSTFNGSNATQILVIDQTQPNQITVASGNSNGFGDGHSSYPRVSDDGRVLFFTNAGNLTNNFANGVYGTVVVRNLQNTDLAIAARRANGTPVLASGSGDYALSSDGSVVAFVATELTVTGGMNENQVFVAPRP